MPSKLGMRISKYFGPSTLIAAAFIGPGTVTVCTLAGVSYGYDLLFALLFAIVATIVLQEVAARVGLITQSGLGIQIRSTKNKGIAGFLFFYLVLLAILVGNSAYEAGNLGGGILGVEVFFPKSKIWNWLIAGISFGVLSMGSFKWIQNILIALVLLISGAFFLTLFYVNPNWWEVLKGFMPKLGSDTDWLMVIGLIGTTVVPYNLFLHASTVKEKYKSFSDLSDLRWENAVAVLLGGLISILIVIVAASSQATVSNIQSAADLAVQLKPALGDWAAYGIGAGLFAAGISSAITAPYAAALAAKELFNWDKKWQFSLVWMLVLGTGLVFSLLGFTPIWLIKFAQVANGLLLPILAFYLLFLANRKGVLGNFANSKFQNVLLFLVCLVTLLLSAKVLLSIITPL